MAKVNTGSMFHIANGRDAVTGETYQFIRSAHSMGGNKAFRRCVADHTRGHGGDARAVRANLASAAKSCAGTRRGGR